MKKKKKKKNAFFTPAQVKNILEFSCARARDGCAVQGPNKGKLLEKHVMLT